MSYKQQLAELGNKILNASRTELFLSMRFMGSALDSLEYTIDLTTRTVGTDAVFIRFNPEFLMQQYLAKPVMLNRLYVHMILHCIFRHMFELESYKDKELYDLCADITVESLIDSMEYKAIETTHSDYRSDWYDKLNREVKVLTAERLYRYFSEHMPDYDELCKLRAEFTKDDHSFWELLEDEESNGSNPDHQDNTQQPPGQETENGQNNEAADGQHGNDAAGDGQQSGGSNPEGENAEQDEGRDTDRRSDQSDESQKRGQDGSDNTSDSSKSKRNNGSRQPDAHHRVAKLPKELEDEWKKKADRMKVEMEASGHEASDEYGSLLRTLRFAAKRRKSYKDFLKRFAVIHEETKIDPDSFDYGFYQYGMDMYGNIPLVEENEYRESRKIKTLIIAIDTSASCQDRLVQRFLNETADILSRQESFFHKADILIIECDDRVQEEIYLRSPEDLKHFAEGFKVRGGYGTDFRPVFKRIAELEKTGRLKNIRGIMYFTDGYGTFPDRKVPWDTAIVLFRDEAEESDKLPDWAYKLYLDA